MANGATGIRPPTSRGESGPRSQSACGAEFRLRIGHGGIEAGGGDQVDHHRHRDLPRRAGRHRLIDQRGQARQQEIMDGRVTGHAGLGAVAVRFQSAPFRTAGKAPRASGGGRVRCSRAQWRHANADPAQHAAGLPATRAGTGAGARRSRRRPGARVAARSPDPVERAAGADRCIAVSIRRRGPRPVAAACRRGTAPGSRRTAGRQCCRGRDAGRRYAAGR